MFGIERVLEELISLHNDVKVLQADMNSLLYRDVLGVRRATEPESPDPATERINRMFTEGLDAVFSFDGKARSHDEVKGNGE